MSETLLWPRGAPQARGDGAQDRPALTIHLPEARANGCGVIVNPGGGYRTLASDHEGQQVARWLNRCGIAAFLLRYRVGPEYHSDASLLDGLRAMRWVRSQAADFGLDEGRIGMLGFSAGGHLAAAVGTRWDDGAPNHEDAVERASSRPDFLVLAYAVTNGPVRGRKADEYTPVDDRVTAKTPPAFIVHTHEDAIVSPEQSVLFYNALLCAGVPAELHVFGHGEHGVGLAPGDPDVNEWPKLLHRWLRRRGFLTSKPRVALSGRVTLDGAPPGHAWLTFMPEDGEAPIARVRVYSDADGAFEIAAPAGPTLGRHTVILRHISERPRYDASGAITLNDVREFEARHTVKRGEPAMLHWSSA